MNGYKLVPKENVRGNIKEDLRIKPFKAVKEILFTTETVIFFTKFGFRKEGMYACSSHICGVRIRLRPRVTGYLPHPPFFQPPQERVTLSAGPLCSVYVGQRNTDGPRPSGNLPRVGVV